MAKPDTRSLRLLLFAAFAVLVAALLWFLVGALNGALTLWREIEHLPAPVIALIAAAVLALLGGSLWIGRRLLRPRPRKPRPVSAPTREAVELRLDRLRDLGADTRALQNELIELDRRRGEGVGYVALFGEISAGKSSLIRALAPGAATASDVLGGTTTRVAEYRGRLDDGRELVLADVPGSQEIEGRQREQIARDEALRAHLVVYVADADLTRQQDAELRWLHGFGKPLLLALNKTDRYSEAEREALIHTLQSRYREVIAALVPVSAGGEEEIERVHADGRRERLRRERPPDIAELQTALQRGLRGGLATLEPARDSAVLAGLGQRMDASEADTRTASARGIVDKYTRRAVIGAMAAVAPGSDLVIQGALATGLMRELTSLYGLAVKELDLDAFLARATLTVRTATTVILAIAGNALKAFPGFGTLGGGLLHAIAYGLVFDSLGRAVAATLAEQHRFDAEHATAGLQKLLGDATRDRLRHVADIALSVARDGDAPPP